MTLDTLVIVFHQQLMWKKQWQNFSQNLGMKNETTLGRGIKPWT